MGEQIDSPTAHLSIGTLAQRADVNIETIRYYERVGLLPDPPRTDGGHRLYQEEHLKRLIFIRRSRELGFTIEDIRGLLGLVDGGHYTCAEVKTMTLGHLDEIRAKVADLKRLEKVLHKIASQCDGGNSPDCPIIEALFQRTN